MPLPEENPPVTAAVSILIVCRNQNEALRRTLESLAVSQDRDRLDVLVVDNASTDGGAHADAEFPFVKMLRMQRNFGWTKAVNVGTRTAKGEFLLLTPPGSVFGPSTVWDLVAALESDAGAAAVAPLAVDAQGTAVTRVYPLPDREVLGTFWRTGHAGKPLPIDRSLPSIAVEYVTGSPILLRRQAIAGMNYLDEKYGHFWADAEIAFQIRRAGKVIRLVPSVTVGGLPPYLQIPDRLDRAGAMLSADAAHGAAIYLSKREGFAAGLGFRAVAILISFGALFGFRQWGARALRFWAILTGQKIDGAQGQ